jgi:hypothetical protein
MSTQYAESVPSLTSKSSKYNVYQTDGKPLSEEAIYRAKLKYGIYNNPAKVTLGVDPSASDTAAVLAANTDLSIHAYSKELSSEAAHAALIAKPETITAYKRTNVAPEAEYAALSAKSIKYPFNDNSPIIDEHLSEDAAASVLKKPSKFHAKDLLQDIYEFDDIRSGKATLSQFLNVPNNKSVKSLSSNKDYRSGIRTSNLGAEISRKMNIGDITKTAAKSADKTLNKRLTPEKDYRSGIKTLSSSTLSNTNTSIYINNIHNQAIKASTKELNKTKTRTLGIETPSDKGLVVNPNSFAASALKMDLSKDNLQSTLKGNSLVTNDIYAIATKKANAELEKLNTEASSKNFFLDAKANEIAYKVAQENAIKRKAASVGPGEISLGKGLKMKYSDIEQIAASLVNPALADMESRIVETRALEEERKQLPAKMRQRNEEFKEEQRKAQLALEKKRADEAQARRDQLVVDKQNLEDEHEEHKIVLAQVLATREEGFNKQTEEEETAKAEIDNERAEKLKILKDTKAEKDAERREELIGMQGEKDEDIAPLLEELDTEHSKLLDLIRDREEKEAIFNDEKSKVDALQKELDDTLSKIEIMNKRYEELESDLAEVTENEAVITSAALAAETQLNSEGKEKDSSLAKLAEERKDLESKRAELHTQTAEKANELRDISLAHHENEKEITGIYPEHLRKEVVKPEDFHDDDLNDSKFELDDSPVEIPAEIESLPETYPEEVWPKVEKAEPEIKGEQNADEGFSESEPNKNVSKKTWDEIRANADNVSGDPLANIPTQEKPPMADIVGQQKVNESIANTAALKKSKATASKSTETGADATAKTTKTSGTNTIPIIKSGKKGKGFLGLFKSGKSTKEYVQRTDPVDTTDAKKKFKGLQEDSKPKAEAVTKKSTVEPEKKTVEGAHEDEDVFSGFSQGSEVEA